MSVAASVQRLGLVLVATVAIAVAGCGSSNTSASNTGSAAASGSTSSTGSAAMSGSSGTSTSGGGGMAMPASSVRCPPLSGGGQVAMTGTRVFILSVGPSQTMYSSQQIHRMHPKHGEVMVGGHMQGSGMGNMNGKSSMSGMGGMTRHLEVHICTRRGNKVVTKPAPKITLTSGARKTMVPVAEMEGIGDGMKDFHFGNNVHMTKGQTYTVQITEANDHASFRVAAK